MIPAPSRPAVGAPSSRGLSLHEVLTWIGAVCSVRPGSGAYLIALDIDGMLLTGKSPRDVPEVVPRAVAGFRADGHHVVAVGSRSLTGVLPVARALGAGWVVASGGAAVARLAPEAPGGYAVETVESLDVEPVARLALRLVPDVRIGVEDVGTGHRVTALFADGHVDGPQRVVGHEALWALPAVRMVLAAPGAEEVLLEPVRRLGVTADPVGPGRIGVAPVGASKVCALEVVRRRLGVPANRTVALSDGANHIEALVWAALGAATSPS